MNLSLGIDIGSAVMVGQVEITAVCLLGQSNAVGQDPSDAWGLPLTASDGVIFWPRILGSLGEEKDADTVQALQYTAGPSLVRGGPECQMGFDLVSLGTERLLILKVVQSGTNVASWLPDAGTGQYAAILEEYAEAVAAAEAQWPGIPIRWRFCFCNGESEAGNGAATYKADMEELIASLRSDFSAPTAPVYIARTHGDLGLTGHLAAVRTAQAALVSEGTATALIDKDDLPLQTGDLHDDGWAIPNIGRRFALAITGGTIPTPTGAVAATDWRDLITAQGGTVRQYVQGDVGVNGTTWEDQTANGFHYVAEGEPSWAEDATLNDRGVWTYDGSNDAHACTNVSLVTAPATSKVLLYGIFAIDSWTAGNHTLWAANSATNGARITRSGSGGVIAQNGATTNRTTAFGLSHWRRLALYLSASTADELIVGNAALRGVSLGTNSRTGRIIGRESGGTQFSQQRCAMAIVSNGYSALPRDLIDALDVLTLKYYGTGLVLPRAA